MRAKSFSKNNIQTEEEYTVSSPHSRRIKPRKLKFVLSIIVCFAALWCLITFIVSFNALKIVVLDNDQIYFGKFITIPFSSTITLKHAYYLQTNGEGSATSSLNVISISEDIHAPKDFMVINRDHIMYYQSLRPDSTFANMIAKQNSGI